VTLLWPRLERAIALPLVEDWLAAGVRPTVGPLRHRAQTYSTSGGARVTEQTLELLREGIVQIAAQYGFPDDRSRLVEFDRAMAPRLLELMPMSTAEALTKSVWTHTALVVAPDVTHWRWVAGDEKWNVERWVCSDRTRHMFARLWWQARQLSVPGPDGDGTSLLDQLSESELNHLTERTSIGGCGPLVRALAGAVVRLPDDQRKRNVVRNAALRLLRLTAVVDPYALDEAQLQALAARVVSEALAVELPAPPGIAVPLPPPGR
jgi:hypothetical protein